MGWVRQEGRGERCVGKLAEQCCWTSTSRAGAESKSRAADHPKLTATTSSSLAGQRLGQRLRAHCHLERGQHLGQARVWPDKVVSRQAREPCSRHSQTAGGSWTARHVIQAGDLHCTPQPAHCGTEDACARLQHVAQAPPLRVVLLVQGNQRRPQRWRHQRRKLQMGTRQGQKGCWHMMQTATSLSLAAHLTRRSMNVHCLSLVWQPALTGGDARMLSVLTAASTRATRGTSACKWGCTARHVWHALPVHTRAAACMLAHAALTTDNRSPCHTQS